MTTGDQVQRTTVATQAAQRFISAHLGAGTLGGPSTPTASPTASPPASHRSSPTLSHQSLSPPRDTDDSNGYLGSLDGEEDWEELWEQQEAEAAAQGHA